METERISRIVARLTDLGVRLQKHYYDNERAFDCYDKGDYNPFDSLDNTIGFVGDVQDFEFFITRNEREKALKALDYAEQYMSRYAKECWKRGWDCTASTRGFSGVLEFVYTASNLSLMYIKQLREIVNN